MSFIHSNSKVHYTGFKKYFIYFCCFKQVFLSFLKTFFNNLLERLFRFSRRKEINLIGRSMLNHVERTGPDIDFSSKFFFLSKLFKFFFLFIFYRSEMLWLPSPLCLYVQRKSNYRKQKKNGKLKNSFFWPWHPFFRHKSNQSLIFYFPIAKKTFILIVHCF